METALSQLDALVASITKAVKPLKIILFGSAVRGEVGPNSDIDLLVVMPEGTHRRHTAQHLYRVIAGINTPFDLVVATPGDLQRYGDNPSLVYHTALREGRIIYGG